MSGISSESFVSMKTRYELIQWKKSDGDVFLISRPVEQGERDRKINSSAFEMLKLMDGKRSLSEVVRILHRKHSGSVHELTDAVQAFTQDLISIGILEFRDAPEDRGRKITVIDTDYWLTKIQIEITSRCNLRCEHCYVPKNANDKEERDLPLEKIMEIIDEGKTMGVSMISLTGGEPLLRGDIFEILDYVQSKNMVAVVRSNGTLIDQEFSDKLKGLSNIYFLISLDGPRTVHEHLRGVNGCFSKTIGGIKNLVSIGLRPEINFTLSKYALGNSRELLRILKGLGYDKPPEPGIMQRLGRAERNDVSVSVDEYAEECKKYLEAAKEFFQLEEFPVRVLKASNCGVGHDSLFVTSEGNVIPCWPLNREPFILGNVYRESLSSIWKSSKTLEKIRSIDTRTSSKKCMSCKHWEHCRGGCRMSAMIAAGGAVERFFDSPNPYFCAMWNVLGDSVRIVNDPRDLAD